ncbi:MAG TPA: hypothetical protein VND99_00525 [Candidatus Acidoferrales bacterium]|nr:hypothetical protein [Candidatus Acidoferrales bacterium]
MKDKLLIQLNKYIEYIKNNKYNAYFIGAITILLILIISMITIIASSNSSKKTSTVPSISPAQGISQYPSTDFVSPSISQISPSDSSIPITTPNPTEAAVIENQTKQQIAPNVAVPYTVSGITKYGDNWANMSITNQDVGSAGVIVKKVNGEWKVVMGPGSFFSADQLQSIGAPQALINNDTSSPSPSELPSPSSVSNDIQ